MADRARDFRKLQVWARAHALTLEIYRLTRSFPRAEQYGLTSQMRRAAASVSANIAEGCGRGGKAELARFLRIAQGSISELSYFIQLATDLQLLTSQSTAALHQGSSEVARMLASYRTRLDPPTS